MLERARCATTIDGAAGFWGEEVTVLLLPPRFRSGEGEKCHSYCLGGGGAAGSSGATPPGSPGAAGRTPGGGANIGPAATACWCSIFRTTISGIGNGFPVRPCHAC